MEGELKLYSVTEKHRKRKLGPLPRAASGRKWHESSAAKVTTPEKKYAPISS